MKKSLRKWQEEALALYKQGRDEGKKEILWEATPGAGKTVAALTLCKQEIVAKKSGSIVIVVPTSHLKIQWARAAKSFGFELDANYGDKKGYLSKEFLGAVLTYQQIGNQPKRFSRLTHNAVVVLDEVHHAGEGLAWGNSLIQALKTSSFILCLSGTAFRSDNNPIPFITYDKGGISQPDYVYSYTQAIEDRVCRPTVFFTYGGEVAWQDSSQAMSVSFNDNLEKEIGRKRLKAALDPDSNWIEPMLKDADEMLLAVRQEHPNAGGLLVASSQKNARALANILSKVAGEKVVTVLSEDPTASKKIKDFGSSKEKWLVACNMVSEGVDIPRLRVGVFATTVKTKMYFRQFLGRIVRKTETPKGVQTAFFYLPADPWLKRLAEEVEHEQKHVIKTKNDEEWFDLDVGLEKKEREDKVITWQALQGKNSGLESVISGGGQLSLWASPSDLKYVEAGSEEISRSEDILSKSELKEEIAKEIRMMVSKYHHVTGKPHSHIHALLNRKQSVNSQTQCSEKQLRERLELLEQLLEIS